MMTKIDSIYRFVSIIFFVVLGLIGVFQKAIPTLYGPDIIGDEAFAFGICCLLVAVGYLILDFNLVRTEGGTPELD